MTVDPFVEMKARQREMWASFAPTAAFTTPAAAVLVDFAGIGPGEEVLDVGTGTGVVAITAAGAGAKVTGIDLTPSLLDVARENARIGGLHSAEWIEGDAEQLPFPDAHFDVVVSQFGHIFAPRPEVAVSEMRRVLRPGGRLAFSSWPPEHFVGRLFAFVARNGPASPAAPPQEWGVPSVIAERLGKRFEPPFFGRGVMRIPTLGVPHLREFMERSVGPLQKLVERAAGDAARLASIRGEFEALAADYFEANEVRQDYLLTRAVAR